MSFLNIPLAKVMASLFTGALISSQTAAFGNTNIELKPNILNTTAIEIQQQARLHQEISRSASQQQKRIEKKILQQLDTAIQKELLCYQKSLHSGLIES